MESPYYEMTHDFEEENRLFKSGYIKGYHDAVMKCSEIVRCKDCKHRPKKPNFETYESGFDIEFPEGSKCPCHCSGDEWYSWYPEDDWFCANGERKDIYLKAVIE